MSQAQVKLDFVVGISLCHIGIWVEIPLSHFTIVLELRILVLIFPGCWGDLSLCSEEQVWARFFAPATSIPNLWDEENFLSSYRVSTSSNGFRMLAVIFQAMESTGRTLPRISISDVGDTGRRLSLLPMGPMSVKQNFGYHSCWSGR